MDSLIISFLTPSKATIRDFDKDQFLFLSLNRTGHPISKSDINAALDKMRDVKEFENDWHEFYGKEFIRIRSIDIDNKNSYSINIYIDILFDHHSSDEYINEVSEQIKTGLDKALGIDYADRNGAITSFEIDIKKASFSSDYFHEDGNEYYPNNI